MTLVFECLDTVRFQVQEMARVEKIISDETPLEDIPEYAQYVDPKYAEQLMSESLSDEDLPSVSLPRKGPASEAAEELSTRNQ